MIQDVTCRLADGMMPERRVLVTFRDIKISEMCFWGKNIVYVGI